MSYKIEKNVINYYTLVYDTFQQNGIFYYKFVNYNNIYLIDGSFYYVYLVAYNSGGKSEKVKKYI